MHHIKVNLEILERIRAGAYGDTNKILSLNSNERSLPYDAKTIDNFFH